MQIGRIAAAIVTIAVGCAGIADASAQTPPAARAPALLHVGHDNVIVDPSLRRYTGVVTALGDPDRNGRIYSFQAKPIGPGVTPPASNEFRGWRLTVLAGKRFASVFEVQGNTASEVTITLRDGPLDGLAVSDVFIIEELGKDPQAASQAGI